MEILTLFVEDSLAKTSQWPESAVDWLATAPDSGSSFIAYLKSFDPPTRSSKMSPAYYRATKDETLPSSFKGWKNSGIASHGGRLTLSISEWPNDGDVCSLSEVLEPDVQPKYYLSPRA